MRLIPLYLTILLSALVLAPNASAEDMSMDIASSHILQSSILKEDRTILIHLPKNYKNSG